ncbi:hypothetical protein POSPLADRAFT_1075734 [Postia placenta MAD-698-R-SB12]|uniref:Uncharacterized protein n=1 Tax=Postia placenta MAD-698-R-SB12 TaxID=670580 RepID=A0A1X6MQZ6_9APHY|nr:hypothetical protein POSPLADRAFT_1075734 [Postia placenta MAD-698-R-SB12]OSX58807.1 hypothetical protein POSPLADRAFT_1075734 [Postia placenta MAD-698-R-SB12]
MPTVPPSFLSLDDDDPLSGPAPFFRPAAHFALPSASAPTPDPDLDHIVLVPPDQHNAVSAASPCPPSLSASASITPARPRDKPRLSLAGLALHSPSPIVGTPFELSPRFEYPFPASASAHGDPYPYAAPAFAASASLPNLGALPGPRAGTDAKGLSPAHPKLRVRLRDREPPVPPSLARKRRGTVLVAGTPVRRRAPEREGERAPSPERRRSDDTAVGEPSDGSSGEQRGWTGDGEERKHRLALARLPVELKVTDTNSSLKQEDQEGLPPPSAPIEVIDPSSTIIPLSIDTSDRAHAPKADPLHVTVAPPAEPPPPVVAVPGFGFASGAAVVDEGPP